MTIPGVTGPGVPVAFSGSPIDRADHIRADPARLAALADARARLLRLDGLVPLVDGATLSWGSLAEADPDAELVFLGLLDDRACFAAVPPHGNAGPRSADPRGWQAMAVLGPGDLAIYGGARSLVDWHARHRFCPACGGATRMAKGGWQRECTACGASHFPRTDAVAIMLVEHDGQLLLGRGLGWPAGRYSALAGFVEPGETIEEAVAREVLEEAGVAVRAGSVRYIASQPWPFPSQLMIGCHAVADADGLTVDTTELADARWFTRAEVAEALAPAPDRAPPFGAPPVQAIAHVLLRWWLDCGPDG